MASIFSKIIAKEIPSFAIKENERFYAFLDIRPLNPGHTLVIPKAEIDHFFDLSDEQLGEIMAFARPISHAIQQVTGCQRVAAVVAGFDVPHAHLHLIPVNSMEELDFTRARPASPEELAQTSSLIIKKLVSE